MQQKLEYPSAALRDSLETSLHLNDSVMFLLHFFSFSIRFWEFSLHSASQIFFEAADFSCRICWIICPVRFFLQTALILHPVVLYPSLYNEVESVKSCFAVASVAFLYSYSKCYCVVFFFFWLWSSIGVLWLSFSCFVAKCVTSPCSYSRAYKFINHASEACVSPLFVKFHVSKFVFFTEEHLAFVFSSKKAIFGASLVLLHFCQFPMVFHILYLQYDDLFRMIVRILKKKMGWIASASLIMKKTYHPTDISLLTSALFGAAFIK